MAKDAADAGGTAGTAGTASTAGTADAIGTADGVDDPAGGFGGFGAPGIVPLSKDDARSIAWSWSTELDSGVWCMRCACCVICGRLWTSAGNVEVFI